MSLAPPPSRVHMTTCQHAKPDIHSKTDFTRFESDSVLGNITQSFYSLKVYRFQLNLLMGFRRLRLWISTLVGNLNLPYSRNFHLGGIDDYKKNCFVVTINSVKLLPGNSIPIHKQCTALWRNSPKWARTALLSRSHTPQSVRRLWTRDRPAAETPREVYKHIIHHTDVILERTLSIPWTQLITQSNFGGYKSENELDRNTIANEVWRRLLNVKARVHSQSIPYCIFDGSYVTGINVS